MPELNVDFLGNGGGLGQVANALMSNGQLNLGKMRPYFDSKGRVCMTVYAGGDPKKPTSWKTITNPLNVNATLRRDEWKQLDEALIGVARTRLNGVADLEANGLVYNLGNAMGTTVLEYHKIGDAFTAELTMDGVTRAAGDRVEYSTHYMPIPIIHVDYEINARVLEASRKLGNPLDTSQAEVAARKVSEKLENMLFTSTSYTFGGGTIYSYLNHPDRNTVNLSVNWDDSAITPAGILQDVLEMKQASINDHFYGPWMLYIPTAYETVLDDDYDTQTPGTTIRERILKIAGIKGIKVVDTLTANNVLLVQMTSDVVRLVKGFGLQNVEWKTEGNMVTKYKVMTIQVPQIRSDYDGRSGVIHLA